MVEEAVGCQMGLECYSRFLKDFFPSLVRILLFPAMPRLFATHPTSGNPTFRNNKPENEPGHVLTKLNQGQSEELFLSEEEPFTIPFESNQTRDRPRLKKVKATSQCNSFTTRMIPTVEKSPQQQWP